MIIYGNSGSGNCLKVKYTADRLNIPYEWVEIDSVAGETRTEEFLAMNPAGQVPCVKLDDGQILCQSNAIIYFLAEQSELVPSDPVKRAKMLEWMFYEQYSHEPYIAVCRFQMFFLGKPQSELDPEKVERGYGALAYMEKTIGKQDFLLGNALTLADISLVAYTRVADEGGFDMKEYPRIRAWIARVENALGLE